MHLILVNASRVVRCRNETCSILAKPLGAEAFGPLVIPLKPLLQNVVLISITVFGFQPWRDVTNVTDYRVIMFNAYISGDNRLSHFV
jgi:hypothetical protein